MGCVPVYDPGWNHLDQRKHGRVPGGVGKILIAKILDE